MNKLDAKLIPVLEGMDGHCDKHRFGVFLYLTNNKMTAEIPKQLYKLIKDSDIKNVKDLYNILSQFPSTFMEALDWEEYDYNKALDDLNRYLSQFLEFDEQPTKAPQRSFGFEDSIEEQVPMEDYNICSIG